MQHIPLLLSTLLTVFAILMLLIAGVALVGHLRKAVIDAAEQTSRIWKSRAEAAEGEAGSLRVRVGDFEDRFARLEADGMLQARRLEMFQRKSDYHDRVIRIIISVKSRIPAEAMEQIEGLLKEMIDYCDKSENDILSLKDSQLYFDKLRRRAASDSSSSISYSSDSSHHSSTTKEK